MKNLIFGLLILLGFSATAQKKNLITNKGEIVPMEKYDSTQVAAWLAGKLNLYDTATMLTGYLRSARTLNGLALSNNHTFTTGTAGTNFAISSSGTTHTFNIPTSSAVNRGLLSAADWSTFNDKQNALTNPVTGTGSPNYLPKWNSSTALGNSVIFDDGANVGMGTTTPASKLDVVGIISNLGGIQVNNDGNDSYVKSSALGFGWNVGDGGVFTAGDWQNTGSQTKIVVDAVTQEITIGSGVTILNNTGVIYSGNYTPTLTNGANVLSSTAYLCQYMRVGNTVTVSGEIDIDLVDRLRLTRVGVSLPIASAFGNSYECGGTGFAQTSISFGFAVRADVTNDLAEIIFKATEVEILDNKYSFHFTYQIL